MASFGLHLLVAEEYLKLHKIDGVEEFIKGNFAPDMVDDKVASHYSTYNKIVFYRNISIFVEYSTIHIYM